MILIERLVEVKPWQLPAFYFDFAGSCHNISWYFLVRQ
jgi:hypothetical protein